MSLSSRRSLLLAPLAVAVLLMAGCDSKKPNELPAPPRPYEGEYKNAKGTVVLQIKENQMTYTDPKTKAKVVTPFTESGDKLVVETAAGNFTLVFKAPDSITGLPGTTEAVKK